MLVENVIASRYKKTRRKLRQEKTQRNMRFVNAASIYSKCPGLRLVQLCMLHCCGYESLVGVISLANGLNFTSSLGLDPFERSQLTILYHIQSVL